MRRRPLDLTLITTIVIAILSLVVSAYVGYSHNDKEISNRVTAVEVQQKNDHDGIQRVETEVKDVNAKMDRLVEWAFGKK